MSGIAGVFHRRGQPASSEQLEHFKQILAHRGSKRHIWRSGPVGLLQTGSLAGSDPIAFDGRLDNRRELLEQLGGLPGTDAELVLRAYEQWGEDCPAHLLGDFAFALWDDRRQHLFCARDYLGVRPFHYYVDETLFLFSSEIRPLLEAPEVPHRPNTGVVAEYLAFSHSSPEETLYQGIQRLAGGTALQVGLTGTWRVRRYWQPSSGRQIIRPDEREYEHEFRVILKEAVACRQGDACLMSGGLDSTSVALLAKVPAYSLVFPGRDCDETPYIDAVVQAGQLSARRVIAHRPDEERLDQLAARDRLPPLAPNYTMVEDLCTIASADGCHTLLTGQGGDHAMIGNRLYYADLLRQGRWMALRRALRQDFGEERRRAWNELRRMGIYPLLPSGLMTTLRRWRKRTSLSLDLPPWLSPAFIRETSLRTRLNTTSGSVKHLSSHVEREYYRAVVGAELAYSMESNDRCAAWQGVTMAHPFLDRRLLEFAFHIPPVQWLRGYETKSLLRRAMAGLLPDLVRQRQDKAEFSSFVRDALLALPPERWLHNSILAREGLIDPAPLITTFRQFQQADNGHTPYRLLGPLWEACSIEWWLRREFGNSL